MAGGTRPQPTRELKKPALRGPTRPRASVVHERVETPKASSRTQTPSATRAQSSPTEQTSNKRKERDFEQNVSGDTNIRVIVRCRGRSDREVKENSGVVVSTEGVKGTTVEVSMGPNALGNKEYQFDKVFSPAADQAIIFEDVVTPILNEMLSGYNCTIFAYGQTGTGKTYTMSGDMTETLGLLSDGAGIIPRILHALFKKIEDVDSSVKCSFIELYNEDLRDLLSSEENVKLKIYEEGVKKGHNGTMIQGVGETYINSASAGIKLLQEGSYRRQVASTKCNDLSSRSHSIFTITTFLKRVSDKGEEYICSGKLNLVDLAGSEDIRRSGAENKRATEAGSINKSLLTLGRVINALVDKSPHIPYRESKLTRLLQDSLGGRTKTCIIATISSARCNLEETMSTLDYAFRAKNIRNKPQINSSISKKALLREFTTEIEKLRSDLIATRQRNGVYLSAENYEEMTVESESRRILSEEQRAKIETMEINLKTKVQEYLALTSNFNDMKKTNESTQTTLDQTKSLLEQTELILSKAQKNLKEETALRHAHQATEQKLHEVGSSLLSVIDQSVTDVSGLRSKIRRRSVLHKQNKNAWEDCTGRVLDVAKSVDDRMTLLHSQHSALIKSLTSRVEAFVSSELEALKKSRALFADQEFSLSTFEEDSKAQNYRNRDTMNKVLEEIKVLREDVQVKVGEGLNGLSSAAARISGEVIQELQQFDSELHSMYGLLSGDFTDLFKLIVDHLRSQREEVDSLRTQLRKANEKAIEANEKAALRLESTITEERQAADAERSILASQIQNLLNESSDRQAARFKDSIDSVKTEMRMSGESLQQSHDKSFDALDNWDRKEDELLRKVLKSESELKSKMKDHLDLFISRNTSIHKTTNTVHEQTVQIVDEQKKDMAVQMEALDDFVRRARSQNNQHCEASNGVAHDLGQRVREGHQQQLQHLEDFEERGATFRTTMQSENKSLGALVKSATSDAKQSLSDLQSQVQATPMAEYVPTGTTPEKTTYKYEATLPRTESHSVILARLGSPRGPSASPSPSYTPLASPSLRHEQSPTKSIVYHDSDNNVEDEKPLPADSPEELDPSSPTKLREVDINVMNNPILEPVVAETGHSNESCKDTEPPPLKRHLSSSVAAASNLTGETKIPTKRMTRRNAKGAVGGVGGGRENISIPTLNASSRINARRVRSGPAPH
ncbi:Kinesin-related motor protein [Microsporum canis]|uniref:Kinesin heavy chain isoform 5A n=1 Tax=Arthroderma otae (strain ATCC MYA-4605 / CBS 113480) TaxID=554155 RepID=C5FG17_ARTOC|nr:kinesin heavy chain isoform 5A [Microsporum canis CBS 113480]EEQ29702.1 kinesin heavy chain isoform 5A [Microsporum canis CBS 113480]